MCDTVPRESQVVKATVVCDTVCMTNQQAKTQQLCPQHREDYKIQILTQRIETKLALQEKAIREAKRTTSKN